MSLSDILTAHADALRQKTGVSNKLSITDMTRLLDDLSWSKTNLLKGTSDQYREFSMETSNGWGYRTTSLSGTNYNPSSFIGKTITYSATITNLGKINVNLEIKLTNNGTYIYNKFSDIVLPSEKDKPVTVTCQVPTSTNANNISMALITNKGNGTSSDIVKIKDERLYMGTEPGIWTPNPADKVEGGDK